MTPEVYCAYFRMARQERGQKEKKQRNGVFSYDALDTGETLGLEAVPDSAIPSIEDTLLSKELKACLHRAIEMASKVFPHNLRKLFARTFYGMEKDIAKLADILGHSSINTSRIYIMTTGAEHREKNRTSGACGVVT